MNKLILETSRLAAGRFPTAERHGSHRRFSNVQKQVTMLKLILQFHHRALPIIKHAPPSASITVLPVVDTISYEGNCFQR